MRLCNVYYSIKCSKKQLLNVVNIYIFNTIKESPAVGGGFAIYRSISRMLIPAGASLVWNFWVSGI